MRKVIAKTIFQNICFVTIQLCFTDFELENQLPTDTFQFGGQTGNTVIQLIFRKK